MKKNGSIQGTMVDYSRVNNAYVERLKKELWSKGEMIELQQKLKDTKLAAKYGLKADKPN